MPWKTHRMEKHLTCAGFRQSFLEVIRHELSLKREHKLAKQRTRAIASQTEPYLHKDLGERAVGSCGHLGRLEIYD